jgi:plasmid stabilization system protein ParE
MRRFPYGVFYRDTPDQDLVILVVRVLHGSRDTSRHLDR